MQESWQRRESGQGELSYLSGLARRQVKKHSRLKTSNRKRRLRAAVRATSRVGDRRAILGQTGLLGTASRPCARPATLALHACSKALGQWPVTWLCSQVNLWGLAQ